MDATIPVPSYHLVATHDLTHTQSFVYFVDREWRISLLRGPDRKTEAEAKKAQGAPYELDAVGIMVSNGKVSEPLTVKQGGTRFEVLDYLSKPQDKALVKPEDQAETRIYYINEDGVLSECCWSAGKGRFWYRGTLAGKGIQPGKGSLLTALVDEFEVKVYYQKANDLWVAYTNRDTIAWEERQVARFKKTAQVL